ncbi:MAG TPA: tetratricopeptide repeat protein [Burkholderiales bacterium]|nr:tetratricopeptide repeat protein [Burkholderiales bacterium]
MISRPFSSLLVATLLTVATFTYAADDDLKEANRLYQQGKTEQALQQINSYLASKPKDAQARFLKGVILTDQKKAEEAIKVFTGLTEDYPELPEPYNNLAVLYASVGQYERAKIALELAIRTHPSYATAHENLGDIYAQLASRAYDKALQLDKSNLTAQTKLSMIKELFGGRMVRTSAKQEAPAKREPAKPAVATVIETPVAEPTPAAEKSASVADQPEVVATIESWAKAWSDKNATAYLGFYAPNFKTPNGESRESWEKQRKDRIQSAKRIKVSISQPKVSLSGDEATIVFRQDYQSNTLKNVSRKTLELVKSDGRWLIKSEKTGG